MRIHRVRLRDYRGIDDIEIVLAERGVTIVEGPNEVGKSSIAEAIGLVFEAADSSTSGRVRAVQPVDRDVGTEVTIEVTTGPYRFVLTKVWNKARRTELEVLAPEREQLRGRPAHDRVQAILAETLDRPLWDALRVLQGPHADVRFGELVSLGHVLDASAGSELVGDREGGLWAKVVAERDRYWTPTGQPKVDRAQLADAVSAAEARAGAIDAELAELAAAVNEVAGLGVELAQIGAALPEHQGKVDSLTVELDVIRSVRDELRILQAEEDAARQRFERAVAELDQRRHHADDVARLADEMGVVIADLDSRRPSLDQASERERSIHAELRGARDRLAAAEAVASIGQADLNFRRQQIEIEQLTERRDRVGAARVALAGLEAELAAHRVDERLVEELVEADLDVARTDAALRATGATVTIRAATDTVVGVDDTSVPLAAADAHEVVVGDRLTVRVGEVELSVQAGFEARSAADDAARARARFAKLCSEGEVESLAEARRLAERRVSAVRARDDAQRQLRENLRDLTFEQICAKVDGHTERIASYERTRPEEPPLPPDYDQAKAQAARVEADVAAARADVARLEADEREIGAAARGAQIERVLCEQRVGHARDSHDVASAALASARAECADAELERRAERARVAHQDAAAARASAARRLDERRPDQVEALLENAADALRRALGRCGELTDRRRDLQAMLAAKGELGLQEQLDDARSAAERGRRELARWDARAASARRLHDAFDQARARARRRYVAPFRDRIEQLGRLVFGDDVEITLDDDLRPAARTLRGTTLPVEHLSGGAREQLDLISRLACAAIVSADGGAPVILDDTLGWSDPDRRQAMGATIALAGRHSQVIVLTCSPDRFASVGNATVVRFRDARVRAGASPDAAVSDAAVSDAAVSDAAVSAAATAGSPRSEREAVEPVDGQPEVPIDLDRLGSDRSIEPPALVDQGDQLADRSP